MTPTTEAKNSKSNYLDLRKELSYCSDPFELLSEVLTENQRLRKQLNQYQPNKY